MAFWGKFFKSFGVSSEPAKPAGVIAAPVAGPAEFDTSLRDGVTGLFNRKHLIYRMTALMSQCTRDNETLAVVLWDVDGFVDFNNQFGQRAGDQFLLKVAEAIRSSLRPYDEAFRVGGDAFCALLKPAKEKLANDVMDRVRKTVVDNVISSNQEYSQRPFSISTGVVFYPGEHQLPEALLHAAEQALYKTRRDRA
jgi:diguanylate cyclase (GGDEF)-like protein